MRTLAEVAAFVDAHAQLLVVKARLGFREGDAEVDHMDLEIGALPLRFVLNRWCEIVTAAGVEPCACAAPRMFCLPGSSSGLVA